MRAVSQLRLGSLQFQKVNIEEIAEFVYLINYLIKALAP